MNICLNYITLFLSISYSNPSIRGYTKDSVVVLTKYCHSTVLLNLKHEEKAVSVVDLHEHDFNLKHGIRHSNR